MSTVALHCERGGRENAPVLLLGGSLGTTRAMWDPQLPELSQRFDVISFDHRGHGGSPIPDGPYTIEALGRDVLALLDRLELPRASYCGLSIGGMVGIWLAINAPERIEKLILICTSAHLPPRSGWLERAAAVRAAGSAEVVADAVLQRWFTPDWAREHLESAARHRRMIAATDSEGYAGCCEAIAEHDLRGELAKIGAPALVIAGEQDPAVPSEHGRELAAGIDGARLVVLDPGAHLASVQRAPDVTRLIVEQLEADN